MSLTFACGLLAMEDKREQSIEKQNHCGVDVSRRERLGTVSTGVAQHYGDVQESVSL